jgi:hypothetical protein
VAEDAARRGVGVGDHVHPDRRGHLDADGEAGRDEGSVHVPHGREDDEPRVAGGDLVADGDVPDKDVRVVGPHVVVDPDDGGSAAVGEAADRADAAHAEDETDAAAGQGGEGVLVRAEDAHGVDVVGLVELHHFRTRGQVVDGDAVANTVRACGTRRINK